MVSVGLYESSLSAMLPGHHNSFGSFYPSSQYHQDYFPQHFTHQPLSADVNAQGWHLPYQSSRNTAPCNSEWTFPAQTNFLNTSSGGQPYRDNCLELDQPITVNTDHLTESPQSAVISSTNSPGDLSPKSCNRYTCYDWVKAKPDRESSSPSDPPPNKWKTRTKDKYRVVYTDRQRLELEKEFHYSRYITINRKAELSKTLDLSERQIKIWFQNRRAKERKINKKKAQKREIDNDKDSSDTPLPVSMTLPPQNVTSLPGHSMTSLRRDDQYTPIGGAMGYQPQTVTYGSMMQNMNLGYAPLKSSLDLNSGFVKSEYSQH